MSDLEVTVLKYNGRRALLVEMHYCFAVEINRGMGREDLPIKAIRFIIVDPYRHYYPVYLCCASVSLFEWVVALQNL